MARIGIIYDAMHGSTRELANALADGVREAGGEVHLRRIPAPPQHDVHERDGEDALIDLRDDVPVAAIEELPGFDGLLIGSPPRSGDDGSQLQRFFDRTGPLWLEGKLTGKPVGFFTGAAITRGGRESTPLAMSAFAYHHGMVIVPVGYGGAARDRTTRSGGPYGATHLTLIGEEDDGFGDDERELALEFAAQVNRVADLLVAAA